MRRFGVVLAATLAMTGVGVLPAAADDTVVVHGTHFPDPRSAQLTLVGCGSLYERGTEFLQPYVSRGPATEGDRTNVPLGTRSLKYDLAGGNALGTLSYVDSMASTSTAGLQVYSRPGAQGVAYAGFQRPDAVGHELWIGRAPLLSRGGWQQVDATSLTYTWVEYDMLTGRATGETAPGPATVAAFAAANGGDGAGFFMVGFGCDGAPFYFDAWRVGGAGAVTTYDLEGFTTTLTIGGSTHEIDPGGAVTLDGSLRDGAGDRLVRGTMLLEAKPAGRDRFEVVEVVEAAAGDPQVTVRPEVSTIYRWRFADRPLATGSISPEFRVDVAEPEPAAPGSSPAPKSQPHKKADTAPDPVEPTKTPALPEVTSTPEAEPPTETTTTEPGEPTEAP